mgnify:CR=1 FL=1
MLERVEILGVIQQEYPELGAEGDAAATEQLGKIKTLQGIIDWINASLSQPALSAPCCCLADFLLPHSTPPFD